MAEPISLELAKQHCRVLHSQDDVLIQTYIKAAREYVENITGAVLVQREVVEQRDEFGCYLELNYRPVVTVDEVAYLDEDGVAQTYADYVAAVTRNPARVYPALDGEWPTLSDYGGVTVTYTAGYAEGDEPQALLQAMLLLIAHWYQNREAVTVGDVSAEVQIAVQSLCAPFWRPVA